MKKLIITVFISLLLAVTAHANRDTARTSGEQTGDVAILSTAGLFYSIVVMPDGSNDVTVSFYDHATSASGTEFLPTMTFSGSGGPQAFAPPFPIPVFNGIYIDVTTSGTVAYIIQREPGR